MARKVHRRDLPKPAADKPEPTAKIIALAIHGVGNPTPGEIQRNVKEALNRGGVGDVVGVEEFNWNQLVDYPLTQRRLSLDAVESLSRAFGSSSSLAPDHIHSMKRFTRLIGAVHLLLYRVARLAVAVGLTSLLMVPPVTFFLFLPFNLLGGDSFRFSWAVSMLWSALGVAACSTALLWVVGAVGSAVGLRPFGLWVAVGRTVLLVASALVVISMGPFFVPWDTLWDALRTPWTRRVSIAVIVILLAITACFAFAFPPWAAPFVWLSAWIMAGVLLVRLLGWLCHWVVGPFLKILLDIFRYVGIPDYRRKIQTKLDEKLKHISDGESEVVIVGHSLGSVIAVDSLINSEVWDRISHVTLITMGSPLRQFFYRFFPNILFPASIESTARAIVTKFPGTFRWLNVYRPNDPIGRALGLEKTGCGVDRSTGQNLPIFKAHLNYWKDYEHVLQVIKRFHADFTRKAPPREADQPVPPHIVPDEDRTLINFLVSMRPITGLAALFFIIVTVTYGKYTITKNRDQRYRAISEKGIETRVRVESQTTFVRTRTENNMTSPVYGPDGITGKLTFRYPVAGVETKVEEPSDRSQFFDKLFGYISLYDNTSLNSAAYHHIIWASDGGYMCRLEGVRLKYSPDDPKAFILLDYPPKNQSQRYREISQRGVETKAIIEKSLIYYWYSSDKSKINTYIDFKIRFQYPVAGVETEVEDPVGFGAVSGMYSRLYDFESLESAPSGHIIWAHPGGYMCRLEDVRLKYSPDDPKAFILPDYPPRISTGTIIFTYIVILFFSMFSLFPIYYFLSRTIIIMLFFSGIPRTLLPPDWKWGLFREIFR